MPSVPHYTPISYTGSDGLALYARDYAAAGPDTASSSGAAALAGAAAARLPVICIHGLTRNSADFDEFAPIVAGLGRRVLALDVRGRGESARDPDLEHYTPQVYADDVEALMDRLGIARAVFVGTSMGGLITMTLAARKVERIAAAVLNDIGPVISHKGLERIAAYVGRQSRPATWEEAAAAIKDINACAFPGLDDADWDKWARRAFAPDASGRLALRYDPGIAKAMQTGKLRTSSPGLRKGFRRLAQSCPVLLVRGQLSDLLEPRQADWMRRQAPGMAVVEVPGVGHAPMLTEPEALAAITRFLATVP